MARHMHTKKVKPTVMTHKGKELNLKEAKTVLKEEYKEVKEEVKLDNKLKKKNKKFNKKG